MFGLDHDRLVSGGNEILKASNDVGRILFQSAAGIGSLGVVRDALESEADKLWARRKSGDRAYYAAAAQLAAADAALKLTVVRTREWSDARASVDAIEGELADLKKGFLTLETERTRLERVRRVTLSVQAFAERSRELAELGEVPLLPTDAARLLAAAETGIATAASEQKLASQLADEARAALSQIAIDEAALRHAEAITNLAQRAQQTRFHERDIGRRQIEIEGHREGIADAVRQLGWPVADEATVEARLPPLPTRSSIAALIKRCGVIEQALVAATESERAKKREIGGIAIQLEGLACIDASPELRAALDAAQGLGDFEATRRREATRTAKTQRDLRLAETKLGQWRLDLARLRELVLPAAEEIRHLRNDFDRLGQDRRTLATRQTELTAEIAALTLEVDQFRRSRQAVTVDDLAAARDSRDGVWASIKNGTSAIGTVAAEYESQVRNADDLSDKRHDKAQEAADLQARIDTLERKQLQLDATGERLASVDGEIAAVEGDWGKQAMAFGFPDMPLLAYDDWRLAHAEVLTALEAVEQALAESGQHEAAIEQTRTRLHALLTVAGQPPAEGAGLDVLIKAARTLIDGATTAEARREELNRQRDNANQALAGLGEKLEKTQAARDAWQASWTALLAPAGLAAGADVGAIEGALKLFDLIDHKLKTIREIRQARIEAMRQDLENFEREAADLVEAMAPELHDLRSADRALELSKRLDTARDGKKEAERLAGEYRRFEKQMAESQQRINAAEASIAPLLNASGSTTRGELHEAIAHSDAYRSLTAAAEETRQTAESGGDGLSLVELSTEIRDADIPQIPARLGEISSELETARNRQVELAANLATAKASLGKIAGKDDAARAEAARQDALARMADAVERYIKVHTAGRLLRWAIDRYRETRQGPMLARASEIFSRLTRASFAKLIVDFECDPPTLDGLRPDGKTVGIAGMSDGTRDQLYLALRLAALEMHIGQAHALPFIADDLFINYDDDRALAGIEALARLSESTQVIFLTHHEHLVPTVRSVFGEAGNIVQLLG